MPALHLHHHLLPQLRQVEVCVRLAGQPGHVGPPEAEQGGREMLHGHGRLQLAPPLPSHHLLLSPFRKLLMKWIWKLDYFQHSAMQILFVI